MDIDTIHESLVNGQRRQMTEQVKEYGSDFWADYGDYLKSLYVNQTDIFNYFYDAVVSYFRITNR